MTKSITFTEGEGAPHPGFAQGPAKGKTGPGGETEIETFPDGGWNSFGKREKQRQRQMVKSEKRKIGV